MDACCHHKSARVSAGGTAGSLDIFMLPVITMSIIKKKKCTKKLKNNDFNDNFV